VCADWKDESLAGDEGQVEVPHRLDGGQLPVGALQHLVGALEQRRW